MRSQKLSDFTQSIASTHRQLSPYGSLHQNSNENAAVYYQMNSHLNSQSNLAPNLGNSSSKDGQHIQMDLQQRISEVRNKLQSKRQSGVIGSASTSTNNKHHNESNNIMSTSNLNAHKSPLDQHQKQSTLMKSQSQANGIDILKRKNCRQSLSPFDFVQDQSMFFKKAQLPEKKSFNDFLHSVNRIDTSQPDTSMDSLLQICNILPDSKGKRKDQLMKTKSKISQAQKQGVVIGGLGAVVQQSVLSNNNASVSNASIGGASIICRDGSRSFLSRPDEYSTMKLNAQKSSPNLQINNRQLLSNYLTNRTNLYENNDNRITTDEVSHHKKKSMFFESNTATTVIDVKQKENKESFHQYFSVQEKQEANNNFNIPKMSIFSQQQQNENSLDDPFEIYKKQSQNYKITENQATQLQQNLNNRKEDLKSHLDDFLKFSEKAPPLSLINTNLSTIRSSCGNNPNNQLANIKINNNGMTHNYQHTHHELFASFSSPQAHQEVFTLGDQQPQSEVKNYHELKQSYVEVDDVHLLPNFFQPLVQSPTPKFSIHIDKDSFNHMESTDSSKSIRNGSSRQLQQQKSDVQLYSDKSKSNYKRSEYAETTRAKNIVLDFTSFQKQEDYDSNHEIDNKQDQIRSKFHLNLENVEKQASIIAQYTIQSVREQSKKQVIQYKKQQHKLDDNEEKFTANDEILAPKPIFVRHQKSNSKPSMHFMSKLQYKNPLFQTHQGDFNAGGGDAQNNQNEDLYSTKEHDFGQGDLESYKNATCFSPLSDQNTQVDKLNVLSRTASMDHYLSNCTTFLRGQRFLSPSNKLQKSLFDGQIKTKDQIRDYFVKLLVKKFQNHKKSLVRDSVIQIKQCIQNLRQAKIEKLNILILIKSFLMKQDAIARWGKLRTKEIFKRKGYAIYNLVVVLSQQIYRKPFQLVKQTDQYKEIIDPLVAERTRLLRKKWCQKGVYATWAGWTKYQRLLRRRAQLTQRALYNIIQKNRLLEGFNQLNLNRLRKGSFNSLNLKIKEYLQNMSAATTSLSETSAVSNKYDPLNINVNKTKILKALSAHQLQMALSKIKNNRESLLFTIFNDYKLNQKKQMEIEKTLLQVTNNQSTLLQQIQNQKLKISSLAMKSISRILSSGINRTRKQVMSELLSFNMRCKGVQILGE